MSSFTRPPFSPWLSLLFYCPCQLSHHPLMLHIISPQVRITLVLILVVAEDTFMVIGVPIITTTTPKTGLIFIAFRDLLTPTRCRVIDNKTEGIINHCLCVFLIVFLIMIFLCIFGCLCFPFLHSYHTYKLDFCLSPCVFLGYNFSHLSYHYLDLVSQCIYISRHVCFYEDVFSFDKSEQMT